MKPTSFTSILFRLGAFAERKISGLNFRTIDIEEGGISYLQGGSGTPLILLHGFGADKDNWVRLARYLTRHFQIIALDLPGFGESFKNPGLDYDVQSQVQHLNSFVNAIGLKQFHLAGNSMGGYIAGNYAATYPEKTISLWLLNTLGVQDSPNSEMFEQILRNELPVILTKRREDYEVLLDHVFHKRPFIPGFAVSELSKSAKENFSLHHKIFKDIHKIKDGNIEFSSPLDTRLKGFPKPTLITWGEKDRILHPRAGINLSRKITGSKLKLMDNIGHLPMIESPKMTANQFISFESSLQQELHS
ncbi:alpha/beta fold hydrolase [Microbulbifer sp. THAF38]|uniref:alpha/beta fold hydrolase n=1 Tax=Microbulbifer sp. THAF38 TaxID=2587856 RepID=UPI00126784C7|nr:alpha/beta hydrolase [Microbulbifer sp. THAF38]QFT55725.1 Lipase 1 precursor [Microbulbifer sp. THAF38]